MLRLFFLYFAIDPGLHYGKYNPDTNEAEELFDKLSIVELQIPKR